MLPGVPARPLPVRRPGARGRRVEPRSLVEPLRMQPPQACVQREMPRVQCRRPEPRAAHPADVFQRAGSCPANLDPASQMRPLIAHRGRRRRTRKPAGHFRDAGKTRRIRPRRSGHRNHEIVAGDLAFEIDLPGNPADKWVRSKEHLDQALHHKSPIIAPRKMSRFVQTDLFDLSLFHRFQHHGGQQNRRAKRTGDHRRNSVTHHRNANRPRNSKALKRALSRGGNRLRRVSRPALHLPQHCVTDEQPQQHHESGDRPRGHNPHRPRTRRDSHRKPRRVTRAPGERGEREPTAVARPRPQGERSESQLSAHSEPRAAAEDSETADRSPSQERSTRSHTAWRRSPSAAKQQAPTRQSATSGTLTTKPLINAANTIFITRPPQCVSADVSIPLRRSSCHQSD